MNSALKKFARCGARLNIPVLDIHAHWGIWEGYPPVTPEDFMAEMDILGIDVTIISSFLAIEGEYKRGNDAVREACEMSGGRLYGYIHVGAAYPELIQMELERCLESPVFKGVKVYQGAGRYDDMRFNQVWEFASQHHLPVLAHTWGGDLTGLDVVAQRFPSVTFMAAHAGSDFAYQSYVSQVRGIENLFLDLTYSCDHTNMIEHFVRELGAERIVWGTDAPLFSMAHQLSKVLFANISEQDKQKILHHNASGFFSIS